MNELVYVVIFSCSQYHRQQLKGFSERTGLMSLNGLSRSGYQKQFGPKNEGDCSFCDSHCVSF